MLRMQGAGFSIAKPDPQRCTVDVCAHRLENQGNKAAEQLQFPVRYGDGGS